MKTTSKAIAAGTVAVVGWGLLVSGVFVTRAEQSAEAEKLRRESSEQYVRKEEVKEVLRDIRDTQKEMQRDLESIKVSIARRN